MSPRAGLNQKLIIEKALDIADKNGIDHVTMATLAKELKIKSPSLYNHFKGLNELKDALSFEALTLLYHHLKDAALATKNGPESIRSIAKSYMKFANEHPGIYEATLAAPDPLSEERQGVGAQIVSLIQESLSVYSLDDNEMIHAIRGLRSILHGLVDLNRSEGFKLSVPLEDSQAYIIDIYLKGLRIK